MENPFDEEPAGDQAMTGSPSKFRNKSRDVDRYEAGNDSSDSDRIGEAKPKTSPSDGEKLLKASLERRTGSSTPVISNTFLGSQSLRNVPDATLPSPTTSRMARIKKIRSRRDRITVVQNPSPEQSASPTGPSSPARSPKPGSNASTPRTSPSRKTRSSPSRKASPSSSRSSPNRSNSAGSHPNRERVAGGAFAKLIGPKADEDDDEIEETYSNGTNSDVEPDFSLDIDEYSHLTELDRVRRKARVEYDIGPDENKRYKLNWDTFETEEDEEEMEDTKSEATLPSILDRSEVFHENATAAILALLNPKGRRTDAGSVVSGTSGLPLSPSSIGPSASGLASPARSAASGRLSTTSPRHIIKTPISKLSPDNRDSTPNEVSAVSGLDAPDVAMTKIPNQPLLNVMAEQKLELMKKAMIDPSKTLADLLTAIASPPEGKEMNQAYMVRRKNACGALKVLTAKEANRRTIGWTVGVLPALASVLHDGGEGKLEDTFPDQRIRTEFVDARKRAVSALLNLCLLKENRIPIFHCPGLLHGLAKTIMQDSEESRQGCTAVLGFLAKTPENRLLLVKVPGILDALNNAIKPWTPKELEESPERRQRKFVWDSTSGSYSMTSSPSRNDSTDKGTDADSATDYTDKNDDGDSDLTPQMTTSPTSLSLASRRSFLYDNDPNKFVNGTRQNVFATLLHAVKEKDNAVSEQFDRRQQSRIFHVCLLTNSLVRF